jgi:hypothetical protein
MVSRSCTLAVLALVALFSSIQLVQAQNSSEVAYVEYTTTDGQTLYLPGKWNIVRARQHANASKTTEDLLYILGTSAIVSETVLSMSHASMPHTIRTT